MYACDVLLVEDESVTRKVLEALLQRSGFSVQATPNSEVALSLLAGASYGVLITDLHMQGMDGISLIPHAHAIDPDLEVIVLTGGATVDSAIAALNYGACAYLRKPIMGDELEQRVSAALQRRAARSERAKALSQLSAALQCIAEPSRPTYAAATTRTTSIRIGLLEIDPARRRVSAAGQAVALSPSQFDLLIYLARRADIVHSSEQLAREVLGYDCHPSEARELIKASIHRLRHKIEADPRVPTYLLSVRGAGYMLSSGE